MTKLLVMLALLVCGCSSDAPTCHNGKCSMPAKWSATA